MLDLQSWSPLVVVCLAACGIGVLVVGGFFFRLGLNIFTDVLGGIAGTQRARLPAPPPRPSFRPSSQAQSAPPPPITFDEALARRQGSAVNAQSAPSWGVPAPPPRPGTWPTVPPQMPPTAPPPVMPPPSNFPPVQPRQGSSARPSLSPGVPYRPPVGPPTGMDMRFSMPSNPFDERRRARQLQDDRYEIYTDEDDAGGGLDMLF